VTDVAAHTTLVTDEAIERLRQRIGVPERSRRQPFNEFATIDTIRHYAHGFGDDNPLWCDPAYAASSVWGENIAPPMFAISSGVPEPVTWSDQEREAMSGGDPLRGVGQYLRAERWHFAGPVRLGTRLTKRRALVKAELTDPSAFAGGHRGAVVCWRVVYSDDAAPETPLVVNEREFFYTERDASPDANRRRELASYDEAAIAEIDAAYERESRRGSQTRTSGDVSVGEELETIVRGPLTVTDVMAHHVGTGLGGQYGVGALRLAYANRQQVRGFYTLNPQGVPDVVQRCHWEDAWANELGHPAAYDYGMMRMTWMSNLVTNWMGDGALMTSFEGSARKFNYLGDTQWLSGTVTEIAETSEGSMAHLTMEGTNQLGQVTCRATATVLLPSDSTARVESATIEPSLASFDRDALVSAGETA
jgi:acyl dehydratase